MEKLDFKKFVRGWVLPLAAEVVALLLIFNFVINITYVPTGSMIPTIEEHSVLLEKTLIKRLVGLPGETVRIEESGDVYINDVLLAEPYVVNQEVGYTGTFTVPEGCYFFLGDNRSGSSDARVWENPYIPGDDVMSRAVFTLFPLGDFGILK